MLRNETTWPVVETLQTVTPVTVVGFKRLEPLLKILQATVEHHEGPIFVSLDKERHGNKTEGEACRKLQQAVKEFASSRDNVYVRVADQNLGVVKAIPAAIDWVLGLGFEKVIILEEDCLPSPDFFKFMELQLDKYLNDERVMMVSGNHFLPDRMTPPGNASYYYSRFIHIWGWATWARAWEKYDHSLSVLQTADSRQLLKDLVPDIWARRHFAKVWKRQISDPNDQAWASRWLLACLVENGLCVSPAVNLIKNIGFGGDSTHTRHASTYQLPPFGPLQLPLLRPPIIQPWVRGDRWWFKHLIWRAPHARARRILKRVSTETANNFTRGQVD